MSGLTWCVDPALFMTLCVCVCVYMSLFAACLPRKATTFSKSKRPEFIHLGSPIIPAGLESPGPVYNPYENSMGDKAKSKSWKRNEQRFYAMEVGGNAAGNQAIGAVVVMVVVVIVIVIYFMVAPPPVSSRPCPLRRAQPTLSVWSCLSRALRVLWR